MLRETLFLPYLLWQCQCDFYFVYNNFSIIFCAVFAFTRFLLCSHIYLTSIQVPWWRLTAWVSYKALYDYVLLLLHKKNTLFCSFTKSSTTPKENVTHAGTLTETWNWNWDWLSHENKNIRVCVSRCICKNACMYMYINMYLHMYMYVFSILFDFYRILCFIIFASYSIFLCERVSEVFL